MEKGWVRNIGLAVLVLILSSCVTTNTTLHGNQVERGPKPPLYKEFVSISKEKYVLHKNDCSNKATKYCRILIENGYDARMAIIYHPDSDYNHVIVVVYEKSGNRKFYDPTNHFWGSEVFDYSLYVKKKWYNKRKDYGLWQILEEIDYKDRMSYKDGTELVEYKPEE
jgi:hypothetical protein